MTASAWQVVTWSDVQEWMNGFLLGVAGCFIEHLPALLNQEAVTSHGCFSPDIVQTVQTSAPPYTMLSAIARSILLMQPKIHVPI